MLPKKITLILTIITLLLINPLPIQKTYAAASFVQATSCNLHNNFTCTATLGNPATANNLLVAFCGSKNAATLTDLSDYSPIQSNENVTPSQESWYKIASGGETSLTCTTSSSSHITATLIEYSGIDTTSPLDTSTTAAGSGDVTAECPSVTPSSGNRLYISGLTFNANSNASSWSNSFMERIDINTGGGSPGGRFFTSAADKISNGTQSTVATSGSSGSWRCHTAAFNEAVAPAVSVSITTDGTIAYGTLASGENKSTLDLTDTQTARNDSTIAEDFNIKTSAPSGWSLGSSSSSDTFIHEFSTTGGALWTKFTTADTYQSLATNISASGTQNFDLRFTAPNPSTSTTQKTITITIQAVQH